MGDTGAGADGGAAAASATTRWQNTRRVFSPAKIAHFFPARRQ